MDRTVPMLYSAQGSYGLAINSSVSRIVGYRAWQRLANNWVTRGELGPIANT